MKLDSLFKWALGGGGGWDYHMQYFKRSRYLSPVWWNNPKCFKSLEVPLMAQDFLSHT